MDITVQKETKVGAEVEGVPEIPMPEWEKDKKKVKAEQMEDKTLDQERGWADKQERDFEWRTGLLCHINRQAPEDQKLRIVVPNSSRTEVFKLAHPALTGGHYSQKRTRAVINRKFTWPTLRKDVINWCQTCPPVSTIGRK